MSVSVTALQTQMYMVMDIASSLLNVNSNYISNENYYQIENDKKPQLFLIDRVFNHLHLRLQIIL